MPGTEGRKRPNPFYLLLIAASAAFVVTTLGYLAAPLIAQKAAAPAPGASAPGAGSVALAAWVDRWAPTAIAVEVGVMIVAGLLAMAFERGKPGEG